MHPIKPLLYVLLGVFLTFAFVQAEQLRIIPGKKITTNQSPQNTPETVKAPAQPIAANPQLNLEQIPLKTSLNRDRIADMSLSPCATIPKLVDAIIEKNKEVNDVLKEAGAGYFWLPQGKLQSYYVAGIRNNCCSQTKSFSVQEQQAAGCTGNDTVAECMEKLTRECIRKTGQALNIREDLQERSDQLSRLSDKTAQLSKLLKDLMATMP